MGVMRVILDNLREILPLALFLDSSCDTVGKHIRAHRQTGICMYGIMTKLWIAAQALQTRTRVYAVLGFWGRAGVDVGEHWTDATP
jgi:hypothetical protein